MPSNATKPTTLDLLYRFFRHENPYTVDVLEGPDAVTWNVASGTMEEKTRLYRIVYRRGETTVLEDEVSYTVGERLRGLVTFYNRLVDCVGDDQYTRDFQLACLDLLNEDPWLVHIRATCTKDGRCGSNESDKGVQQ